jgi:serine/threonine protein kinase
MARTPRRTGPLRESDPPADAGGKLAAVAGPSSMNSLAGDAPPARMARLFASPAGVLVILPALVIAAGVIVLLLGRRATRDTAETMARHQLVAQAHGVQHDVAFALDQANPVLASLRMLAEPALPTRDAMVRLHDIVIGRPGIYNAAIVFPIGVTWEVYRDPASGELRTLESRVTGDSAQRTRFKVERGQADEIGTETAKHDPRTRPYYVQAVESKGRVWLPPRVFSASGKTGLTVSEPVFDGEGNLGAVLTIDFDVGDLSAFIRRPPLEGARTVMFTADGTILAYPAATMPKAAHEERRLLRHDDFQDAALAALFREFGSQPPTEQRFLQLATEDGEYLASVSLVGARRGTTAAPIDWYLATLVPERTLFGAMHRLGRDSIIASGGALAIAMGVALMFAWNLVRMRRAVGAARAQARSAEERAKQLGSYRLVEKLGAGGMGEVWRAEHQLLARKAAIKLVRADVLRDVRHAELLHERFRREAQTLASMRSRHTIELYDYGVTDDGTFFYVMELLEGLDLSNLVRGHGPQPAARVISILDQACKSLAEAHDAGLLHRDIKPANLVLCRAADEVDIVKVLDFGIVHNLSDPIAPVALSRPSQNMLGESGERLTTEGAVIGTPGYIPPEQAIGAPLDARGDLYALGCVAWYLLTGSEVYPYQTEDEVLRAHVHEAIPHLGLYVRGWLPPELENLISSCLAKEPSERPETARALARALSNIAIPVEHAWTQERAIAWWQDLQPRATEAAETTTAANARVLVPQRQPTAVGQDAHTIDARPSAPRGRAARRL